MTIRTTVLGGLLAAAAILVAAGPEQIGSLPTLCLFQLGFGWECPGCGMLRALAALGGGDLQTAISYNWKVVIVAPLLAYLVGRESLRALRGR